MRLQEKLTQLRKEKALSQLEVAEAVKVSRQAVSKWEAGTAVPSTDNLKFLSRLYGVSVDYLLDDDSDIPEAPEKETQVSKTPAVPRKIFTLERKIIAALSCAVVLLLAALIYEMVPKETEEVPVIPIGELEVVDEDNDIDGEFSILW